MLPSSILPAFLIVSAVLHPYAEVEMQSREAIASRSNRFREHGFPVYRLGSHVDQTEIVACNFSCATNCAIAMSLQVGRRGKTGNIAGCKPCGRESKYAAPSYPKF
jgi:hypothetical protein